MNVRRLALYLGLLVVLAGAGLVLAVWGLTVCAPPPLPGDELWTWRQTLGQALSLVFRANTADCFTGDPAATAALAIGERTAIVLLVVLALMVLWETAGRALRLAWFRSRGGHVILAGTRDDVAGLARHTGPALYLPPAAVASDIARAHSFAEIMPLIAKSLPAQLDRLGATTANLVAAITPNDLTNVAIAEAVLAKPARGELLLRLEQPSVRALSSHRLRQRAEATGHALSVVSLTALQTRRGLIASMPGRYTIDGADRAHIALCGSGPGLQAATLETVRQGFGLDTARPLVSILRTGNNDFAAGVLERLQLCEAADIEVATAAFASADALDRAITAIVLGRAPLRAIHCLGETPEEAEALALKWEEVLLALHQPVPPIVTYTNDDRALGSTGMIRVAAAPDLAEARDLAKLMDARAIAVHSEFLKAQRAARGHQFGTAPAEADWSALPSSFRDDNRNVADQMDYKLAQIFMQSVPGQGSADFTRDEIETLARHAHSRWWASKALSGWRYGKFRDDRAQYHPDMEPYDQLSDPVKQKDRDEVASLPRMAELAGEALRRERRIAIPHALAAAALDALETNLRTGAKDRVPVAVLPLNNVSMVDVAASLLADGIALEAVLPAAPDYSVQGLAAVLRRAWRIHIANDAHIALATRATEQADDRGGLHALA